jgi:hypothetical protein
MGWEEKVLMLLWLRVAFLNIGCLALAMANDDCILTPTGKLYATEYFLFHFGTSASRGFWSSLRLDGQAAPLN